MLLMYFFFTKTIFLNLRLMQNLTIFLLNPKSRDDKFSNQTFRSTF